MKPKHSKPYSRGMMFVACSECQRGGNGDESCSSGWTIKRGGPEKGAYFSGELLDKFKSEGTNHEINIQGQAASIPLRSTSGIR